MPEQVNPERIARSFHEAYERLAPEHGYKTRQPSAKPWEQVPENNRRLMVATVQAHLDSGAIPLTAERERREAAERRTEEAEREAAQAKQDVAAEATLAAQFRRCAESTERQLAALRGCAEWLVAMDEPGSTTRRTITLTQIIDAARAALSTPPDEDER
jgi:hypothetical protein